MLYSLLFVKCWICAFASVHCSPTPGVGVRVGQLLVLGDTRIFISILIPII